MYREALAKVAGTYYFGGKMRKMSAATDGVSWSEDKVKYPLMKEYMGVNRAANKEIAYNAGKNLIDGAEGLLSFPLRMPGFVGSVGGMVGAIPKAYLYDGPEHKRNGGSYWTGVLNGLHEGANAGGMLLKPLDEKADELEGGIDAIGAGRAKEWLAGKAEQGHKEYVNHLTGGGKRLPDINTLDRHNMAVGATGSVAGIAPFLVSVPSALRRGAGGVAAQAAMSGTAGRIASGAINPAFATGAAVSGANSSIDRTATDMFGAQTSVDRNKFSKGEMNDRDYTMALLRIARGMDKGYMDEDSFRNAAEIVGGNPRATGDFEDFVELGWQNGLVPTEEALSMIDSNRKKWASQPRFFRFPGEMAQR